MRGIETAVAILQCLLLLACDEGDGQQQDAGTDTETETETNTESDTGPPGFDCSTVPDQPLQITQLDSLIAWHDVAFTADGQMIGWDTTALFEMTYEGEIELFVPLDGELEGMDHLPSGDLVVADASIGRLLRVTEEGYVMNLATGFSGEGNAIPYGVLVGPDGMVYAAGGPYVTRVDPETGDKEELVTMHGVDLRAVHFSPGFELMYISARSATGDVYAVEIDDDLTPTGEPFVFATGVCDEGAESWQDGLGVDVCGNLYVPEFLSNNLYRVSPEGDVELLVDWEHDPYGHNVEWGNGAGGWKEQAIYLPQPYNGLTVVEVDLGVPGHVW